MKKTTKSLFNLLFWISLVCLWGLLLSNFQGCTNYQPHETCALGYPVDKCEIAFPDSIEIEILTWYYDGWDFIYYNFKTGLEEVKAVESWRDYIPQEPKMLQYYDTLIGNGKSHLEAASRVFVFMFGENKRKPI